MKRYKHIKNCAAIKTNIIVTYLSVNLKHLCSQTVPHYHFSVDNAWVEGQVYIMMTLMDRLGINTQVITQKRRRKKQISEQALRETPCLAYTFLETRLDQERCWLVIHSRVGKLTECHWTKVLRTKGGPLCLSSRL